MNAIPASTAGEVAAGRRSGAPDNPAGGSATVAAATAAGRQPPALAASLAQPGAAHEAPTAAVGAGAAAATDCSFDCRLAFFGLCMHGATQVVSLLAWSILPGSERFQRLLSIALAFITWLLPAAFPSFYLRWRKEFLIAYRMAFFAFPLLRKARGIQRVLDSDPQPGVRGIAKDLLRIIWGSRLMAVLIAVLLNPLPLLPLVPHLLIQIYTVGMVRSNSTLCATPLLTAPLTATRIHTFHSTMHLLAMVLPGGVGQSMHALVGKADNRAAECESFISFLFLTAGLAFPIWMLLKTEPPPSLRGWEEGAVGGGCGSSSGSRLRRAVWRVEAVMESAIRQLCGRSWLAPTTTEEDEFLAPQRPRDPGAAAAEAAALRLRRHRPPLQPWERGLTWWLLLALLWSLTVVSASSAVAGAAPPATVLP